MRRAVLETAFLPLRSDVGVLPPDAAMRVCAFSASAQRRYLPRRSRRARLTRVIRRHATMPLRRLMRRQSTC